MQYFFCTKRYGPLYTGICHQTQPKHLIRLVNIPKLMLSELSFK